MLKFRCLLPYFNVLNASRFFASHAGRGLQPRPKRLMLPLSLYHERKLCGGNITYPLLLFDTIAHDPIKKEAPCRPDA